MKLTKIEIIPENKITLEVFCAAMPSVAYLKVLVMKFSGVYGDGSGGNGDANYMSSMTLAALSFTDPFGLIFDFTHLSYDLGDMMTNVIFVGENRWVNDKFPLAIIVSDKCEVAITSLLRQEHSMEDLSLLHESLDSALSYIDSLNKFGLSN